MIRYLAIVTFFLMAVSLTVLIFILPTPSGDQESADDAQNVAAQEPSPAETNTGSGPEGRLSTALLGDFEGGLIAPEGFGWTTTDDQMANGKSESQIEHLEIPGSGSEGAGHALQITSVVRHGFAFPWAGAAVMSSQGWDTSRFTRVSFAVRGTPGSYRLMGFHSGAAGVPPSTGFRVSGDWTTVTIPFSELVGMDPRRFSGLAFVAGPGTGDSTLHLDNVRLEP